MFSPLLKVTLFEVTKLNKDVSDRFNGNTVADATHNFPKWQLVYYYYRKWADLDEFELLLSKLRETVRLKLGQNKHPSLGIVDGQSVRWGNNRSLNGADGNKKVKGIKLHALVDKNGL